MSQPLQSFMPPLLGVHESTLWRLVTATGPRAASWLPELRLTRTHVRGPASPPSTLGVQARTCHMPGKVTPKRTSRVVRQLSLCCWLHSIALSCCASMLCTWNMHRGDKDKGSAYRPSLRCTAVTWPWPPVRADWSCQLSTSRFGAGLAERLTRMEHLCLWQQVVLALDVCGMAHCAALPY